MFYKSEHIVIRAVTEADIPEIARTWPSKHSPLAPDAAKDEYDRMKENYTKIFSGTFRHLCLAICEINTPEIIIGWCGFDGNCNSVEPEIFVLLDREHRNLGYGTECIEILLINVAKNIGISCVHGGCRKNNIASQRAMEKAGMTCYGHETNGDPLFRYIENDRMDSKR